MAGRPLPERLMDALDAAQAAGGDARGMQSGAIVITRALGGAGGFSDRNRQLNGGDAAGALKTALAARDKAPENDNAWVALANIHLKAGRKADALAAIAKAIELNAANRRQLLKNRNFETLFTDPEFKRLTTP